MILASAVLDILGMFHDRFYEFFIGKLFFLLLLVTFHKLIYDLTFLEAAVANGCQDGIPVLEAIFPHDRFHQVIFQKITQRNALGLTVGRHELFSFDDIVILQLIFEPLVDLVFRLGALDDLEPVPAGSLGVLGGNDLDPVSVLDHIIDVHQFSVDSGSYHLISDRTVDTVGKIDRR